MAIYLPSASAKPALRGRERPRPECATVEFSCATIRDVFDDPFDRLANLELELVSDDDGLEISIGLSCKASQGLDQCMQPSGLGCG